MGRAPSRAKTTPDPSVIVDADLRDGLLWLDLVNGSRGPVRDVRVSFKAKLVGMGGALVVSDLPIWTTVHFMPPGRRISVPVDRPRDYFARERRTLVSMSIAYTDVDGALWRGAITHDLAAWRGFPELM